MLIESRLYRLPKLLEFPKSRVVSLQESTMTIETKPSDESNHPILRLAQRLVPQNKIKTEDELVI